MQRFRRISPHAKQLRQDMADAERLLWFELRGRRLRGHKFKRQWTIGPFIVDFCCADRTLVIELDGGQHSPERDALRTGLIEQQRATG